MRERMEQMQLQMQEFVQYVQQEVIIRANQAMPKEGLVPVRRPWSFRRQRKNNGAN